MSRGSPAPGTALGSVKTTPQPAARGLPLESCCIPIFFCRCCACRRTKQVTTAYESLAAGSFYGLEPDCSRSNTVPAETVVHYTGAKLLAFNGNGCNAADFAQIVLGVRRAWRGAAGCQLGGKAAWPLLDLRDRLAPMQPAANQCSQGSPVWVPALDLVFCADRACGTAVELGARCSAGGCCVSPLEGGFSQVDCVAPQADAPSVCTVTNCPDGQTIVNGGW